MKGRNAGQNRNVHFSINSLGLLSMVYVYVSFLFPDWSVCLVYLISDCPCLWHSIPRFRHFGRFCDGCNSRLFQGFFVHLFVFSFRSRRRCGRLPQPPNNHNTGHSITTTQTRQDSTQKDNGESSLWRRKKELSRKYSWQHAEEEKRDFQIYHCFEGVLRRISNLGAGALDQR